MPARFEELDYRETALGPLSLRRRREPMAGDRDVWEVKLGDEFLMSSLFTASETALAHRPLAELEAGGAEVLVGGLGLGYTALAALEHPDVAGVRVVELLAPVIDWHRRALLPIGAVLAESPRCVLQQGDFFELALGPGPGFDAARPGRQFDAVLVDIDHSPAQVLAPGNARLYTASGLAALAGHLRAGGVLGLWSNDPADPPFVERLRAAFGEARAETIAFANPYTGGEARCTVYCARKAR